MAAFEKKLAFVWLCIYNIISLLFAAAAGLIAIYIYSYISKPVQQDDANRLRAFFQLLENTGNASIGGLKFSSALACLACILCFSVLTSFLGLSLLLTNKANKQLSTEKKRRLVAIYLALVIFNVIFYYAALSFVFNGYEQMKRIAWESMERERQLINVDDHGKLNTVGQIYSNIQRSFSCCGGYGPRDWITETAWFMQKYDKAIEQNIHPRGNRETAVFRKSSASSRPILMFPCLLSENASIDDTFDTKCDVRSEHVSVDCIRAVPPSSSGCNYAIDAVLQENRPCLIASFIAIAFVQLFGMIGAIGFFCIMCDDDEDDAIEMITCPPLRWSFPMGGGNGSGERTTSFSEGNSTISDDRLLLLSTNNGVKRGHNPAQQYQFLKNVADSLAENPYRHESGRKNGHQYACLTPLRSSSDGS